MYFAILVLISSSVNFSIVSLSVAPNKEVAIASKTSCSTSVTVVSVKLICPFTLAYSELNTAFLIWLCTVSYPVALNLV